VGGLEGFGTGGVYWGARIIGFYICYYVHSVGVSEDMRLS
jgi:hypothetical protein